MRNQLRDQVHAALTEARTAHPDLPDPAAIEPGASQRVLDRVEAIDRARRVSGGAIPFLIGNAGAAFTDPVNLATLPFGAPARLAGSMGVRILRAALIEGGIAGASQAVTELGAVPYRRELGVESNAPGDILAAAAGGAVLGGAFRALVEGVIALRGGRLSQAERDAIVAGARADADHESNPLGAARAPEHEAPHRSRQDVPGEQQEQEHLVPRGHDHDGQHHQQQQDWHWQQQLPQRHLRRVARP